MSRTSVVVALAIVLLASAAFALVPTPTHATSAPSPTDSEVSAEVSSHPSAAITFTILNGYGYSTEDFYPGEVGWGSLYFLVTDHLDTSVNVTLTDPNATRDGVAAPAFHYVAKLNSTTSSFNSYRSGVGYAFPPTLPYGGGWTVNFSAPNGGSVRTNITTYVYYVHLSTSVGSGSALPGNPMTVFWTLFSGANGATIYTHATNVWITGTYLANGTPRQFFSQGRLALLPAGAGTGAWSGHVPLNATPNSAISFEVYAVTNVSGQIAENETEYVSVDVGALAIQAYGITVAPPTCGLSNAYYFVTGSLLTGCLEAGSSYLGGFTPIPGLPVTVGYWNGTTHVDPAGAPTALTTNTLGEATFTFNATSPPFVQDFQFPGVDALNFTVEDPGASSLYHWTAWLNATWTLLGNSPASGVVEVLLDHTQYYAGNTATVTWSIDSTDLSQTGPITANGWEVSGPNGITYAVGSFSGSNQSGTFSFPVTPAMVPNYIDVGVWASNATQSFYGYAYAYTENPALLLTRSSYYYSAGSTTSVGAVLEGGGTGAVIQYQVWGYWQEETAVLATGSVSNGSSISVSVASTAPPQYLEFKAWATSAGQVIASNEVELELDQGYTIQLGVSTASSYSDGSYQPGQTVTLQYAVVSVNGAALPNVVSFELLVPGYPTVSYLENVALSGSFSYTIPSNAVQGSLFLELEAVGALSAGTCFGGCIGLVALTINPNPSFLSMELGAGSGLTVGWLILLVLVIVVAAVLVLTLVRRRGGRRTAAVAPTMSPPAPPPSTAPPEEWQAPPPPPPPPADEPASDSAPPRLPEPPPPR